MRVRFHSEARAELREARTWYARRSPLAALAFAQAIDEGIARIREAPLQFHMNERGEREYVVPWKFPYTIVYRVMQREIIVLAICHHRREPRYWDERV